MVYLSVVMIKSLAEKRQYGKLLKKIREKAKKTKK